MSAISITKLYDFLSAKIGRDTAQDLTHYMEDKVKEELDNNIQVLATKADVANTKVGLIKWMFIFWVGQVAATFEFILLFLKK